MSDVSFHSSTLAEGRVLLQPVGHEQGYWVGAPGVFYHPEDSYFYLTYRIRRPRGIQPDRGGETRIARTKDLENLEDLWGMTKDQVGTASIERSHLRRAPDGRWHWYTSYVDPADGRWCLSRLVADSIPALDPSRMERVFSAGDLGLEGVKDPWILEREGRYFMFLSVAVPTESTREASHETLDIYNTGECTSATGLAVSSDLNQWEWQGLILQPGPGGWDKYCRRINSVLPVGDRFLAFYDGSASHAENYEERTALATSADLRTWECLNPDGPEVTSPHTSGSLRYLDACPVHDKVHLFYEFARADGAHDLRITTLDPDQLACLVP